MVRTQKKQVIGDHTRHGDGIAIRRRGSSYFYRVYDGYCLATIRLAGFRQ